MVRTSASQFHQCVVYVKLETVVIILKVKGQDDLGMILDNMVPN
jgi:hypothetical protein